MDGWILVVTSFILLSESAVTSSYSSHYYNDVPLTVNDVTGHVNKQATLRCHFKSDNSNPSWYKITWQRVREDGTTKALVRLKVNPRTPEWPSDIPISFQSRVHPMVTFQPDHVEFNLRITNLTCSDQGKYRCSVLTEQNGEIIDQAVLTLASNAKQPRITEHYRSESVMRVECSADVGLPPKVLVWYQKPPRANYFFAVDGQHDIIESIDGCHFYHTRFVDIKLSKDTEGTIYRCGYKGFIETQGVFAELVLETGHTPKLGVYREEEIETIPCKGDVCDDQTEEEESIEPVISKKENDGDRNIARETTPFGFVLLVCCIFIAFV